MNKITGKLSKIFYRKDEFLIGKLATNNDEEIKIIGNIYGVDINEEITVKGEWETHSKYGRQLKVEFWERPIPQTEDQVLAFLSSSMVKGAGKKTARRIVDKLGEDALNIISEQRESCLIDIKGIRKKRAKEIVNSVIETYELQKIIAKLLVYGITSEMAIKLYKEHGSNTLEVIKNNPYELTNLNLIGFQKADEIAKKIGVLPTSGYRIEACLNYILKKECYKQGHSFISEDTLIKETDLALNHNALESDTVSEQELETSLISCEERFIVNENKNVYPSFLYQAESGLADKISKITANQLGRGVPNFKKHIKKYEKEQNIKLAPKQIKSIEQLFKNNLMVLTGGPGTGKTTVVKAMVDIHKKVYPDKTVKLTAPTGRASQKLADTVDHQASTIHKLIGYRKGEEPTYNSQNKLICDFLVVDEMSMADVSLIYLLLRALRNDTKIVFIGDTDQLPSVSPGNVLADLIKSNMPIVKLTEVFRQAQESQIIKNAHRVKSGKSLLINRQKNDCFFILKEDIRGIANLILRSAARFLELGYSLEDILILSPIKKGKAGTIELNEHLRDVLNPANIDKRDLKIGKSLYREGDKVIQTKNDDEKEIYNGDIGIIKKITRIKSDNKQMKDVMIVDFKNKIIELEHKDLGNLQLAYAITIHKSQGGEAPVVIMPVTTDHHIMLARNLLYTGMTRAKEKLVFIGTEKAMNIAIQNDKIIQRNSLLYKRIKSYSEQRKSLIS